MSPQPWDSLNTGSRVGDDPARVVENLRRAAHTLGREPDSLVGVRQVHGSQVVSIEAFTNAGTSSDQPANFDEHGGENFPEADALVTCDPEATLFMRFADCVPILLFDPVRRAAGMAHAGWRGTVLQLAARAVESMQTTFDSDPADLLAGIGPSICAAHYAVGEEVAGRVRSTFSHDWTQMLIEKDGQTQFDLWAANRLILERAGVHRIEIAHECTFEHPQNWFSHRGEHGRTGRFVAMAAIDSNGRS